MGAYGDALVSMGTFGDPLAPMGTCGGLWAPMGAYRGLWGPMGTYGDPWGPMGTYADLWAPMGICGDPWEPLSAYGGLWGPTHWHLWGPLGTHWHLWGPIGTYRGLWGPMGLGASIFCTPIFDTNPPPPFLLASDLYQTYHTSCWIYCKNDMPYQTSEFKRYTQSWGHTKAWESISPTRRATWKRESISPTRGATLLYGLLRGGRNILHKPINHLEERLLDQAQARA